MSRFLRIPAGERLRSRLRRSPVMIPVGLILCSLTACESASAPESGPELTHPCVSWCNTAAPWRHDGVPYEGLNFVVYSDGASLEARMELARIAEGVLASLKTLFGITSDDELTLPPGQSKIHLYAYRYRYQASWGARAFLGGLIIFSPDHPTLTKMGFTETDHYTRLVTHELVHVMQNLVVGSFHSYSTHTWFEEGLAELVSGLDADRRIRDLADLNARVRSFGELNPIAIHNDILPPIKNVGTHYYYPMFELTMRYLLDERGLGRSLTDARDVFLDMRAGMSFPGAFQHHFGVSVPDLEAQFFSRIRTFLR